MLPSKKKKKLSIPEILMEANLYSLGMHFSQAVAIVQCQVGLIKGVQVLYSDVVINAHFTINIINLLTNFCFRIL